MRHLPSRKETYLSAVSEIFIASEVRQDFRITKNEFS